MRPARRAGRGRRPSHADDHASGRERRRTRRRRRPPQCPRHRRPPSPPARSAPTSVPGALSRSTSAGDRRYPRLGSADIDVDHYDVALDVRRSDGVADGPHRSVGAFPQRHGSDRARRRRAARHRCHGDDGDLSVRPDRRRADRRARPPPSRRARHSRSPSTSPAPCPRPGLPPRAGLFLNEDSPGIWSVNEPDGTSTWLPTNDHPTDKATWRFEITVPEGHCRRSPTASWKGRSATTPADRRRGRGSRREPMASYLVLLLIGDYERIDGGSQRRVSSSTARPSHRTRATWPYYAASSTDHCSTSPSSSARTRSIAYGIAIADSAQGWRWRPRACRSSAAPTSTAPRATSSSCCSRTRCRINGSATRSRRPSGMDIWLNEGWATYAEWMWLDHEGLDTLDGLARHALARRRRTAVARSSSPDDLFGNVTYDGGGDRAPHAAAHDRR